MKRLLALGSVLGGIFAACAPPEGTGLAKTDEGSGAQVVFDLEERPFPNVPLPNDFATRFDASSPTKKRLNASKAASTAWERSVREDLAQLDGWGTYAPVSVSFSKDLDLPNIIRRHHHDDFNFADDAVFIVNVTPDSPDFCQAVPLDVGAGNFPNVIEDREYFPNDPRADTNQIVFEEVEEDLNHNGVLDPGEDTDMDGVLDHPNTPYPGAPISEVMSFYERETKTLLFRPMFPLRERTTYAVVLTKRLVDVDGRPIRSPFAYVNHTSQTQALAQLPGCLPKYGLGTEDLAFTWSFTTQSITSYYRVIRDGLHGVGPMSYLQKDFPAKLTDLDAVRDDNSARNLNIRIVPGEKLVSIARELIPQLLGKDGASPQVKNLIASFAAVDFFVTGSFESPQFFRREDTEGKPLPLHQQRWEVNPETGQAFVRAEKIGFWISIPKNGAKPAPVVLAGHGYGSNKLEALFYAGMFARQGLSAFAIDCPSHGLGLSDTNQQLAEALFTNKGIGGLFRGLKRDRAFDQTGDGISDSGADYWTAYTVHTRDMVRQSTIDYLRMVQVLDGFDGVTHWQYDVNRDGVKDLAGDFDGDGVVDIGLGSRVAMSGGSLGGIMSSLVGGYEPRVNVIAPISAGGGFAEIAKRAANGGVKEAVSLRMMGPLLLTLKNKNGGLDVWQYAPDGKVRGQVLVAPVTTALVEGDTAVMRNLRNGEYRCGRVQADGLLRVAVSSDEGDGLTLEVFHGALPPKKRNGCDPTGATPYWTVDSFAVEAKWKTLPIAAGTKLYALGDGFGLRRGTPELRGFTGIAQVILDPADPINAAPNYEHRIMEFGTGERVHTRALIMNTIGDPVVAVATGTALARAAGYIDITAPDPTYGKTVNQVLLDTGVIQGVSRVSPYKNSKGQGVLMDIEHFSASVPQDDGYDVPRLDPPLHHVWHSDRVGGMVGVLWPMSNPFGRHGFDLPDPKEKWDVGTYLVNMLARYLASNGTDVTFDKCNADSSCAWIPASPTGE